MKNQTYLVILFMLIGLFALTTYNTGYVVKAAQPSVNLNLFASGAPAISTTASVDSNNVESYSYDFTIFGNTYTAVIVTNSDLSNFTLSETGLGVQFQVSAPSGTTGFCNVTVPAILVGTDVIVFEDGVLLEENVAYTQQRNGTDYLFHLTTASGAHTIVIEAAISNTHTPSPTPSPLQNQSNVPLETVVTIAAVGVAAAASITVVYFFRHMLGKGGPKVPKGAQPAGGGSVNVPAGTNVTVYPNPKVGLTFSQVNQAGAATATPLSSYPALPKGISFRGTVFDIKTTAVFTGLVIVGLLFEGKDLTEEEKKKLRVYRNDLKKDSVWEDVTSSIDTKNNIAYGSTDHFSGFGIR